MPTMAIPFGAGLDRATGKGVPDPARMVDLRNVYLYAGKVQARKGHTARATLAADDVLGLAPYRESQRMVAVAWNRTTRAVTAYLLASNGAGAVALPSQPWFTAEAVVGRPRVSIAEVQGKLVFAHDYHEVKPGATYLRAPTMVYDPAGGGTFTALTADLDRDASAETLRFRGVLGWRGYLVGWGYGTGAEEDRGDMVRISKPGEPLVFPPEFWYDAGHGKVLAVVPAEGGLVVFKESETYVILGGDRTTFRIEPADLQSGLAAPRLAVSLNGRVLYWSLEGPRATSGGTSETLALPLDLQGPSPATLAEMGDLANGFAEYLPGERCVLFCFPSETTWVTRVYCLSLRGEPGWTYWEIGLRVLCAGVITPATAGSVPSGAPTFVSVTGIALAPGYATAVGTANWTNPAGLIGDEYVDIWTSHDAGATWQVRGTPGVGAAGAQSFAMTGLPVDEASILIALRYRRGGYTNAGAESNDPDGPAAPWPVGSRGTFATPAPPAPPVTPNFIVSACGISGGYITRTFTWNNPDALSVIIRRTESSYGQADPSSTPLDGEAVYDGTGTSFEDIMPAWPYGGSTDPGINPWRTFKYFLSYDGSTWHQSGPDPILTDSSC